MANEKSVVLTVYGHSNAIDKIAVSLFDKSKDSYDVHGDDSNAETYCDAINGFKLEGESWVFAKIVLENTRYTLDTFRPLQFDILLNLDDRSIQKILRDVDSRLLAKALKGSNEMVQEKIFNNMSKRAAQMLKEDMDLMGPMRIADVRGAQEKIVNIVRHLEQTGEIVIPFFEGETTA
jgi:flagellar motor switch protein FliG